MSHPVKNRVHVSAQQVATRPPLKKEYLKKAQSCPATDSLAVVFVKGQHKSSLFQAGCTCTNSPNFTSTSHAPAIATCRAVPVSHNRRQASCGAGIATSLNPSHSKTSIFKLLKKKKDKVKPPVWQEIPSVSPTSNFLQLYSPLRSKAQPLSEAATSPALAVTLYHNHSKVTCPAQFSPSYKHPALLQLLS